MVYNYSSYYIYFLSNIRIKNTKTANIIRVSWSWRAINLNFSQTWTHETREIQTNNYIKSFTIFWWRWRWRSNHCPGCNHRQNWWKNFLRLNLPRTGWDCRLSFARNAWEKKVQRWVILIVHIIFNFSQLYESKPPKIVNITRAMLEWVHHTNIFLNPTNNYCSNGCSETWLLPHVTFSIIGLSKLSKIGVPSMFIRLTVPQGRFK